MRNTRTPNRIYKKSTKQRIYHNAAALVETGLEWHPNYAVHFAANPCSDLNDVTRCKETKEFENLFHPCNWGDAKYKTEHVHSLHENKEARILALLLAAEIAKL